MLYLSRFIYNYYILFFKNGMKKRDKTQKTESVLTDPA